MEFKLVESKKPHLCKVKFCRNRHAKGRILCWKHTMQRWRANNPKKCVYYNIKDRARKRDVEFTLTLAEFLQFCDDTGYLSVKGMHIDRIDATEGYHLWNIQALIGSENIAKGNRERHSPRYQEYLRKKREKELQESGLTEEDCPL